MSKLRGLSSYSVTILDVQTIGIYCLAQDAATFDGTLSVRNITGEELCVLSLNQECVIGEYVYSLNLSSQNNLTLNVEKSLITITGNPGSWTMHDVILTANFSDETVSRQYSFDNETWLDYTEPLVIAENKTVYFKAKDSNGAIILDAEGNKVYNSMVFIPNFYFGFKKGTDATGDYDEFIISNFAQEGLTKVFGEKSGVLVGKYFTTLIPNSSLYGSVKGQFPRVNVSQYGLNDSMSFVTYGGNTLQLNSSESKLVWDAIAYLFLIEFANRNCQNIMYGIANESWTNIATDATVGQYNAGKTTDEIVVTNANSATKRDSVSIYGLTGEGTTKWKTIAVLNKIVDTPVAGLTTLKLERTVIIPASGTCIICCSTGTAVGSTDALTCKSGYEGQRNGTLAVGLRHFRYRGIEDVYGNMWNILCDYAYKVTYDGTAYTRQTIKRGENGSKTSPNDWAVVEGTSWSNNDGYVKSINIVENTIVSEVTTGGGSTTYYSDYYYRDAPTTATNYRCFLAGGNGNAGASVGLFYFNCYGSFAYSGYGFAVRSFIYIV